MSDKETIKNRIIQLLSKVLGEEGNELITFLVNSDFFEAPYSTKYQFNYEGGLAEYSLKVYEELTFLVDSHQIKEISERDCVVVGLLHSMYKINYYEQCANNVKWYNPDGKKFDEFGKFDWVSEIGYKVKEIQQRCVFGGEGFNSYMLASKFIGLTDAQIVSIVNHKSNNENGELYQILRDYPLLALLCSAISIVLNVTYEVK